MIICLKQRKVNVTKDRNDQSTSQNTFLGGDDISDVPSTNNLDYLVHAPCTIFSN